MLWMLYCTKDRCQICMFCSWLPTASVWIQAHLILLIHSYCLFAFFLHHYNHSMGSQPWRFWFGAATCNAAFDPFCFPKRSLDTHATRLWDAFIYWELHRTVALIDKCDCVWHHQLFFFFFYLLSCSFLRFSRLKHLKQSVQVHETVSTSSCLNKNKCSRRLM